MALGGTISGSDGSPSGESVVVTLADQTQSATIGTNGRFSAAFDVATLPAAGSPYTVSFAYTTDGIYSGATGTSTLTVNRAAAGVSVSDAGGAYDGNEYAATATVTGVGGASGAGLDGVDRRSSYYTGTYTLSAAGRRADPVVGNARGGRRLHGGGQLPRHRQLQRRGGARELQHRSGDADRARQRPERDVRRDDPQPVGGCHRRRRPGRDEPRWPRPGVLLLRGDVHGASRSSPGSPRSPAPSAVGGYTVLASFLGSTDYEGAAAVAHFSIGKATPQVSVDDPGGTFGGTIPGATDGIASVGGTTGSSLEGIGLTLNYYAGTYTNAAQVAGLIPVDPTRAGAYTAVASFAGSPDYSSAAAVVGFLIAQATPAVAVSDAGGTFDGSADPAAATVAGVVAGVDATPAAVLEGVAPVLSYYAGSYASPSQLAGVAPMAGVPDQAGTYTVLASFLGSVDYDAAATVAGFSIVEAASTVDVVDAGGTYSGSAFSASANVVGIAGPGGPGLEGVAPTFAYYGGTCTSAAQLAGLTPIAGARPRPGPTPSWRASRAAPTTPRRPA